MTRHPYALISVLASVLFLAACGYQPPNQPTRSSATPTVTVSSGASTIRLGQTLQFTATAGNLPAGATLVWGVNNLAGGSDSLGHIDSNGLYTPPAAVPATNTISVGAVISGTAVMHQIPLTLYNPIPGVTAVNPASVNAGTFTLNVSGTNFVSGATVLVDGTALATTFVSATQLTATGTASTPGTVQVTVKNPDPGSATSATQVALNLLSPNPTISGVSPTSVNVGAFTITVTGANFLSAAQVLVNGSPVSTTFVSSTELTASATISTPGTVQVSVMNPAPSTPTSQLALAIISPGPVISGSVIKGPASDATITAYAVNADGSNGAELGVTTTGASGAFSLPLTATPSGAVRLVAAGGTYISEADGSIVQNTDDMAALLETATENVSGITITPLSDMTNELTVGNITNPSLKRGGAWTPSIAMAHAQAMALIQAIYGLSAGAVPEKLRPGTLLSDLDGLKVELINGALMTCAQNVFHVPPGQLIHAVVADIADARFDGRRFGVGVKWSQQLMSATSGTSDFLLCLHQYAHSGFNLQNAGVTENDVTPALQDISKSISGSSATPGAAGLADTNTNRIMATVSYNNRQFLFVILRSAGIAMYDISNPADLSKHKFWLTSWLTASNFYQLYGGVALVAGRDHPQLLVYGSGYDTSFYTAALLSIPDMVAAMDAGTSPDPTEWAGNTPFHEAEWSDYGIRTAVADPGRLGVWFQDGSGAHLVNPDTMAITTTYSFSPSLDEIPESIALSSSLQKLIFPEFGTLDIADLAAAKRYFMDGSFSRQTIASVGIDSKYKVALASSLYSSTYSFLDFTKLTYDVSTFLPGEGAVTSLDVMDWEEFSYFAVDSSSHLVFMGEEWGSNIGVAVIQDPVTAVLGGGQWQGFSDWAVAGPCLGCNAHREGIQPLAMISYDAPRFAVIPNLTDGKTYGYAVINSELYQVDLQAFLALNRKSDSHIVSDDPFALGVIKKVPCAAAQTTTPKPSLN